MTSISRGTQKEVAVVAGAFLSLLAVTPTVVRAASTVWANRGILRTISTAVAVAAGTTLDFPVVLLGGLLTGWFVLFLLDGTKRVQALLVALVAVLVLIPTLGEVGRVIGAVGRRPVPFGVAVAVGLVSGAASSRLYGVKLPSRLGLAGTLRWIQFPAASGAFFYTVSALVLGSVLQYAQYASSAADAALAIVAGAVAVFALSVFLAYEYRKSAVTLRTDGDGDQRLEPYVLGGLFDHVESEHEGFPVEGNRLLRRAATAMDEDDLPDGFGEPVSFGYLSSGLAKRTAKVTAEGFSTDQLNRKRLEDRLRRRGSRLERLRRWLAYHLRLLVPAVLRDALSYSEGSLLNRLDHADTVMLLTRTPEAGEEPPAGADLYGQLVDLYGDDPGTNVVVVTTDARAVADAYEEGIDLASGVFRTEVAERLGVGADRVQRGGCALVPTSRFSSEDEGYDALLREI